MKSFKHKCQDAYIGGMFSQVVADGARADALIAELLAALEALYSVTPNTPPAAGIIIGIEEKHAAALAMTRAAIAKAKGQA